MFLAKFCQYYKRIYTGTSIAQITHEYHILLKYYMMLAFILSKNLRERLCLLGRKRLLVRMV